MSINEICSVSNRSSVRVSQLRASSFTNVTFGFWSRCPVKSPSVVLRAWRMLLLISMPVTCFVPNSSADMMSRPPPTPTTAASPFGLAWYARLEMS